MDEVDIGTCDRDVGTASSSIIEVPPPGFSLMVPTLSKSADFGRFRPKSNELNRLEELESTLPPPCSFLREWCWFISFLVLTRKSIALLSILNGFLRPAGVKEYVKTFQNNVQVWYKHILKPNIQVKKNKKLNLTGFRRCPWRFSC